MAGKPRIVSVSDKPRGPRVVGEVDYTGLIEKPAQGEAAKDHVVFKGLKEEPVETADAVRDQLRAQALSDIKPLSKDEVIRQAEKEADRRRGIKGRIRKFFGLE